MEARTTEPRPLDTACRAFNLAIENGRLSDDESAANYAGHYMFMGCGPGGVPKFKHIHTRQYLDDQFAK